MNYNNMKHINKYFLNYGKVEVDNEHCMIIKFFVQKVWIISDNLQEKDFYRNYKVLKNRKL